MKFIGLGKAAKDNGPMYARICTSCHTFICSQSPHFFVGEHDSKDDKRDFGKISIYCQSCFSQLFDDLQKKANEASKMSTSISKRLSELEKRDRNARRWQSERDSALKALEQSVPENDFRNMEADRDAERMGRKCAEKKLEDAYHILKELIESNAVPEYARHTIEEFVARYDKEFCF